MSPSSAAAAETAPGNDLPGIGGRSVRVADLSDGGAQHLIVLGAVAVVTEERVSACQKEGFCRVETPQNVLTFLSAETCACVDTCARVYNGVLTAERLLAAF